MRILSIDPRRPDPAAIAEAAELLRAGKLVAFPTETVYGLGAHALDADAVERIFAAKGRPPRNPIIVHVPDLLSAEDVASSIPAAAERLAKRFWPGPLTLVLPKRDIVPSVVTGGGQTVAVRVPAHPVALALLEAADVPIAAPSANPSMRLSPTRAEHVIEGLGDTVALILDAGPAPGGIESTVVDVSGDEPVLLRPGLLPHARIEEVLGVPLRRREAGGGDALLSPGMLAKHYAPRTPLELCLSNADALRRTEDLASQGLRVGFVPLGAAVPSSAMRQQPLPGDPERAAAVLYDMLHALDAAGVDRIIVTLPPDHPSWTAIRDRLMRASV
ncbi:MAG: translation factor SUA5 [Candidatus Peregrinibacteria bacterium Gr01-1014_25]|nr:MAG: translation factor SUA5 [Candidatus Peregrinibacteria bacterium Gr01-1014_25]